jgi:hypothetical protein
VPVVGPTIRVSCEACDVEREVASRAVARDICEGHEAETGCPHADWEEVDDE